MKRRARGAALPLEVVDWLLLGSLRKGAELDRLAADGVAYDPFREFDADWPPANLEALWQANRAALLAEATARGIREPWGLRFDGEAPCAAE